MVKVLFVVPYGELQALVDRLLDEARTPQIAFAARHMVGTEGVRTLQLDADIVVARGITCKALREYHPEVPVVEIPVTGYDVVLALDECRRSHDARRVAIIGAESMICGAPSLNRVLDVEVECYRISDEQEARDRIDQAVRDGADAIVGGLTVYNLASRAGVPCTWIKSGPDALRQAVEEAVRTAGIAIREREKAQFFRIIMDYAHEGIVAVDRGGRVPAANRSAERLLGAPASLLVGTAVDHLLPGLVEVMRRGEEELGTLAQVRDMLIAANLVPMRTGDEVTGAVATLQDVTRIQELEGRIRERMHARGHTAKYGFGDIIGESEELRAAVRAARRYSGADANILIVGETGTGKELLAHSIHAASARAAGPFVAVNCAALPEPLLESELFGYAEGAFTGASRGGRAGLFELAHGGTILLDEIGEMPLALQAKLLRAIQEREIRRVGHDRVVPVDVRIIAATNDDLRSRVAAGSFRSDLLFRLDVLRVTMPPLRRRREDILPLFRHFLGRQSARFRRPVARVAEDARAALERYPWPGNVRELMNVCERLAVLVESEEIAGADVLAALNGTFEAGEALPAPPAAARDGRAASRTIDEIEREAILAGLEASAGNRSEAARRLGISRTTLWRRLRRRDSERPGGGRRAGGGSRAPVRQPPS